MLLFRFLIILVLLISGLGGRASAQTAYITPEEALKIHFASSQEIVDEAKILDFKTWRFYLAKTNGKVDGYAVIDSEVGKTEPITLMTFFDAKGVVTGVEILVYRETYGSEVTQPNWRKQFVGKKKEDPLKIGQDIANMTGATLSSRAVTKAVKRDIAVWNTLYGKP